MRYTNTLQLTSDDRLTFSRGRPSAVPYPACSARSSTAPRRSPSTCRARAPSGSRLARRGGVTVYHSVPALFRAIAPSRPRAPRPALDPPRGRPRHATRSRALPRALRARLHPRQRARRHRVRAGAPVLLHRGRPVPDGVVPIGEAVEDMESAGRRCGRIRRGRAGETGEIAVRSAYLAAGYWHQPELTAARFVAGPDRPGARLYRTGDTRPDAGPTACSSMLGRRDGLAKVRGHHVEVGRGEDGAAGAARGGRGRRPRSGRTRRERRGSSRIWCGGPRRR